jgi:hypothetical protein
VKNLFNLVGIEDDSEPKKIIKKPRKKRVSKPKPKKKKFQEDSFNEKIGSGTGVKKKKPNRSLVKPFLIPCAMTDDEIIVHFQEAKKFEDHRCPCCCVLLEIDRENIMFKHPAIVNGCERSSSIHRTAIKLLQQKFYKWKNKKRAGISYEFICQKCGESSGKRQFADNLGSAFPDFPIYNSKGQWAVDLALLDNDNAKYMQAAIYRSFTHHKRSEAAKEITEGQKKVEAFAIIEVRSARPMVEELKSGIMLPWMEVEAGKVLENPHHLQAIDSSFEWHKCAAKIVSGPSE